MPTTPTTRPDPRLTRALAFERVMHAAVGRVVTTAWGDVFLDPAIGRCHERNQGWATDDAGGLDAAAIDRDLDRLLGGAGLAHRRLLVESPAAQRLADGLAARGYDRAAHVYLAYRAAGPPPAPRARVDIVGIEATLAANAHYLATDPDAQYGRDDIVRAHIVEHHRTYGSAGAHERVFVVRVAGAVVAWAKLWTRDRTAQVEDVVCLAEHRGRGYGHDVVAAATRAALERDPELLFIVADDGDWPKDFYGRMGYQPVGHVSAVLRHAPPRG
jgi:ribosomal protein S18 acetylase RimI-like enzyme